MSRYVALDAVPREVCGSQAQLFFFCVCVLSISPVYLMFFDPTDSRCKKATF